MYSDFTQAPEDCPQCKQASSRRKKSAEYISELVLS